MPPKLFCALQNFYYTYNKNKNSPPKRIFFALQNLKTWLWACYKLMQGSGTKEQLLLYSR